MQHSRNSPHIVVKQSAPEACCPKSGLNLFAVAFLYLAHKFEAHQDELNSEDGKHEIRDEEEISVRHTPKSTISQRRGYSSTLSQASIATVCKPPLGRSFPGDYTKDKCKSHENKGDNV